MKMFASLPLYIVTTLFAFECVSALPSMYKQVPRILPGVPKQDPGILRSVPKQDKLKADYALPSMYKQVPRILPGVPKQDPGVMRSVPKQDNGSTDAFSSFNSFSDTPCPPDWEQFNNKCYLLDKMTRTWDEAQAFCRDLGTELVKIDDSHENSFVLGLFRQEGLSEVWIGMKSELTWYDCSVPIYTNWESGEPKGQAVSPCVAMDSSGQWDDIQCINDRASVCEKFP